MSLFCQLLDPLGVYSRDDVLYHSLCEETHNSLSLWDIAYFPDGHEFSSGKLHIFDVLYRKCIVLLDETWNFLAEFTEAEALALLLF